MTRNLIFLLLIVVAAIAGLAWYHFDSVKTVSPQPLELSHMEAGELTVAEVLESNDFKKIVNQKLNYGFTDKVHWFRFSLEAGLVPRELSLEISNHVINEVELFEIKNEYVYSKGKTGDWYPFRQRPSPTKTFVYPIYLDSYEKATYLLKLDKRHENLTTGIYLWNTNDFENSDQRAYLLWGILIGVVFLLTVLNTIFGWITSDKVYIWFTLYVIALTLRQLTDAGLAFQYLWPAFPDLNRPNQLLQMVWLFLVAMIQFQQYFFDLKHQQKWLFMIGQCFKYFFLAGIILLLVLQFSGVTRQYNLDLIMTRVHSVSSSLCTFFFFYIVGFGLRSKDILQRFFAAAFLIQLIGFVFVIVQNLMNYQSKGVFFIEAHVVYLVIFLIDLIFFVYILSVRYRNSYQQNQALQIGLVQARQDVNKKIIESLSNEREQISETLQSSVGDKLEEARQQLNDTQNSPLLSDAVRLIDKAGQDLNQISLNLIPIAFAENGLVKTLEAMVSGLNRTQSIRFKFVMKGKEARLSTAREVQIYRIASEMINNILKHSEATKAEILLQYDEGNLLLCATDNGKGFDLQKLDETTGGIGIRNLYSRADYLKAGIKIDSDQKGTCIALTIPV